ncbi:uncharacterized protein LOC120435321 [Oreochromis aureus]|uniref:uncharacterized protein LOC120435321 n=1 Tax=Oreochromis aureus TaxID=47969 RepID=UPI001953E0A7|nr:uncharacterized protein LOC120435321 [Oreochromis aureus]
MVISHSPTSSLSLFVFFPLLFLSCSPPCIPVTLPLLTGRKQGRRRYLLSLFCLLICSSCRLFMFSSLFFLPSSPLPVFFLPSSFTHLLFFPSYSPPSLLSFVSTCPPSFHLSFSVYSFHPLSISSSLLFILPGIVAVFLSPLFSCLLHLVSVYLSSLVVLHLYLPSLTRFHYSCRPPCLSVFFPGLLPLFLPPSFPIFLSCFSIRTCFVFLSCFPPCIPFSFCPQSFLFPSCIPFILPISVFLLPLLFYCLPLSLSISFTHYSSLPSLLSFISTCPVSLPSCIPVILHLLMSSPDFSVFFSVFLSFCISSLPLSPCLLPLLSLLSFICSLHFPHSRSLGVVYLESSLLTDA